MTIKLLIAEDHELMRNTLKSILGRMEDFSIIGLAENGEKAVALTLKEKPDIILMDIDMPIMNGIEATRIIYRQHPDIGIIAFSMVAEEYAVYDMIEAGARGFVLKGEHQNLLKMAIRTVHNGGTYFSEGIAQYANSKDLKYHKGF